MIKKSFFAVIVLLQAFHVPAQEAFHSVEEAWQYADVHNITIRTAAYDRDKAVYSQKQSYSALLPQLSVNGTFTQNTLLPTTLIPRAALGSPSNDYIPVQFGQKFIYLGGVTAQMDLLNVQSWFNVQMAKNTVAYNEANVANTRKAIYQQVATQFYGYLLMQEAERLAYRSESIADSVFQSINNKFTEGKVNKANLDEAAINLNRAKQTTITARYQKLGANNNLKALLGIAAEDSLSIFGSLRPEKSELTFVFEEDPSINLAFQQTQISLSQYKATKATFLPILSVAYSSTSQRNDNVFRPFDHVTPWYPATYWSLRASWNIFNGGSRWFQTKRNRLAYDEARAIYLNTKNQSTINDENLRLSFQKSLEVYEKSKLVLDLSMDNYNHLMYRYNEGVEPLETVFDAFSDYLIYQNQYLSNLADLLVQIYQVKIRQQSF